MNALKSAYGKDIEDEEVKFYNLFNPEDSVLEFVYPVNEGLLFPLSL